MKIRKLFIDCRLMEGSGITTYINNLAGVLNKQKHEIEINYLVRDLNNESFTEIPINSSYKQQSAVLLLRLHPDVLRVVRRKAPQP